MTVDQIKESIAILEKIAEIQTRVGIRSEVADKRFQKICDLMLELYDEIIKRVGEDEHVL